MNVNEMIEALQEIADNGGGEREILLATQPHYPLAHTITDIVDGDERMVAASERFKHLVRTRPGADRDALLDEVAEEYDLDSEDIEAASDASPEGPVWILEGGHPAGSPYTSKALWNR